MEYDWIVKWGFHSQKWCFFYGMCMEYEWNMNRILRIVLFEFQEFAMAHLVQ